MALFSFLSKQNIMITFLQDPLWSSAHLGSSQKPNALDILKVKHYYGCDGIVNDCIWSAWTAWSCSDPKCFGIHRRTRKKENTSVNQGKDCSLKEQTKGKLFLNLNRYDHIMRLP